ncbi:hypothetical protein ACTG9Q_28685 [Actinokineospora sp. 24-640]
MDEHPVSREARLALARAAVAAARRTKVRPRTGFWSRWADRLRYIGGTLWEGVKELPADIAHGAAMAALTLALLYLWEVAPTLGLMASCAAITQWVRDFRRLRERNQTAAVITVVELAAGPCIALIIWFAQRYL